MSWNCKEVASKPKKHCRSGTEGKPCVYYAFPNPAPFYLQFCVEVTDDGVGFDTDAPIDEKKHVGLRNIRGRLKAMVNGALVMESKPGVGTKAIIMIPKEVTV